MKSNAKTVTEYINEIPAERRKIVNTVRTIIVTNLPTGYEEVMNWGMITYEVPLSTYRDTYNGKPLMYAALANQKNHMAVYLCGLYCMPGTKDSFVRDFKASGKKLNMGASCVRFKKLDDLPLDLIGKTIAAVSIESFVAVSKSAHGKKR